MAAAVLTGTLERVYTNGPLAAVLQRNKSEHSRMSAHHFRALLLALAHAQFEWTVRQAQVSEKRRVGRIDLFCSIYLPFCDLYVTNDREQRRCIAEIAAAAKLPVEVLSFTEFSNRLMPLAHLSVGA